MAKALARLPGWRGRFSACLIRAAGRSFEWVSHNCALFVADGVLAQTGKDFAEPFRGKYSTELGAARALKKYGAGDLEKTIAQALPKGGLKTAKLGDVAIVEGPDGLCGGFWLRANIALVSQEGLVHLSQDSALRIYRVGR